MRNWLFATLLIGLPAAAEEAIVIAEPDARVVANLEALGYEYEVDEDGDFRLLFDLDNERSQLVWIRNRTYASGGEVMRDVWSIALRLTGKYASVKLADRILRNSWESVMGGWARDGDHIVYMVKLPADADAAKLHAAIGEAIDKADLLERDLRRKDDY